MRSARRRIGEIAGAVGETRELARLAADRLQGLAAESDRRAEALWRELAELREQGLRSEAQLDALRARLDGVGTEVTELRAVQPVQARFQIDVIEGLRRVHAEEPWHRRRLREARSTEAYELAFSDPDPLVSVLIPTYERLELLRTRAIPSILAQVHRDVEIVVVGDHTEFGAAEVTAGFERAPIRFANLTVRGPYTEDRQRRWLVAGAPPFNEAMAMARGRWLAPFADDDAMRPNHISSLLAAARRDRLEFVYGLIEAHEAGGNRIIGSFPPEHGRIGLQSALMHQSLSMFELELADSDFGIPCDWARIDRMLRAGVRTGMVDEVLSDYYPGLLGVSDGAGEDETGSTIRHPSPRQSS